MRRQDQVARADQSTKLKPQRAAIRQTESFTPGGVVQHRKCSTSVGAMHFSKRPESAVMIGPSTANARALRTEAGGVPCELLLPVGDPIWPVRPVTDHSCFHIHTEAHAILILLIARRCCYIRALSMAQCIPKYLTRTSTLAQNEMYDEITNCACEHVLLQAEVRMKLKVISFRIQGLLDAAAEQ